MITPQLIFKYSLEQERERVSYTYHKAAWYAEKGYRPRFPHGKHLADVDVRAPLAHFLAQVDDEYNSALYEEAENAIHEHWQWFKEHWPHEAVAASSLVFQPTYEIQLTRYGVSGSYHLPNNIVLNIVGSPEFFPHKPNVLFHEMIHLTFEDLILKYQIPHWHKERLVDLFFKRLIPEKAFEQNLPNEVLAVDTAFAEYYGNVAEIITHIEFPAN